MGNRAGGGARGGGGGASWSAAPGSAGRMEAVKNLQHAETMVMAAYGVNGTAADRKAAKAALAAQLSSAPDHIVKLGGQAIVNQLQNKSNKGAWRKGLEAKLSVYVKEGKKRKF